MTSNLKLIGRIGAIFAFFFCLLGGGMIVLLAAQDKGTDKSYQLWMGFGLYFVGKAFFVGPMLWLATEQVCGRKESE